VFHAVAAAAALGGLALYALLPDRPQAKGQGPGLRFRALASIWTDRKVRASAFGYFGHMWELYTLWVLVPAILATRLHGAVLSWSAFAVVAAGAVGCIAGGYAARRIGSARVAAWQMAASAACCLAAPWALGAGDALFALWLLVWGITVVGDSPQFSALTAANAPREAVGSVLTLVNSIGFGISIVSILLFVALAQNLPLAALLPWLALGPLLGLLALRPLWR
jgi:predicted MFS family arabinose efflux permease